MPASVKSFLCRTAFLLLAVLCLAMGIGTFIEKSAGTQIAHQRIYGSAWFALLWGMTVAAGTAVFWTKRVRRCPIPVLLLHTALSLILAGALVTRLTGMQGRAYLRIGYGITAYTGTDGRIHALPFSLRLINFEIPTQGGAATDFRATIDCEGKSRLISMNRILRCRDYRFTLQHYDDDFQGVTLGVSSDPFGLPLTYGGYALLVFSMVGLLTSHDSRFRRLLHDYRRLAVTGILLLCTATSADAGSVFTRHLYQSTVSIKGLAMTDLSLGLLLSAILIARIPHSRRPVAAIPFLSLVYLLYGLTLRGLAGNYLPISNGYEVMLFMAASIQAFILTVLRTRDGELFAAGGLILSGCCLLAASLFPADIARPAPVLRSWLLPLHVSLVMTAYVLFFLIFFTSLTAIIFGRRPERSTLRHRMVLFGRIALYPAVFLLAAGIFTGAIWAEISWGSYWNWDPKEVWALITLLTYAAGLHDKIFDRFSRDAFFLLWQIIAFASVLMTCFGVNNLLGGLHSYAN